MNELPDYIISALEIMADESSAVAALIDAGNDYRILWTNKRLDDFLGFSVKGMLWGGRCPFAFGINALEVIDKVVETGEAAKIEERPFGARVSSRFGETTYWNWKVLPAKSEGCPGCVLVTAENVTDHVARKAAARKHEALFDGIILDLPVGVAVVDAENLVLADANDLFLSYLRPEFQTRDSIGKTLDQIMPNLKGSGLEGILGHVASSREVFSANEFELQDSIRGSVWWSLTIRPVDITGGKQGLLITLWDVTEQVHAKRRLESSRLRAQAMIRVQQAISASLTLDEVLRLITDSAIQLMNSEAASVFLLSEDKRSYVPSGASGIELTEANTKALEAEYSLASRAIREGRPVAASDTEVTEVELLPKLNNGREIAAIAAASIRAEDKVIGVIEVYNDERRRFTNDDLDTLDTFASAASTAIVNARLYEQAERNRHELHMRNRALDNERNLLIAILDSIPDAVAVTDASQQLVRANEAARSLFGTDLGEMISLDELIRKTHPRKLDGEPLTPAEHPIARALKGEGFRDYEFTLNIDDQTHYRSVSGSPVTDKDGNVIFAVTVGRDITEQKRLQVELESAYERERRIAQTFQQALLSELPNQIDGFQIASVYEAGLRESEIGGDFFDVFSPAEGKLAIVIGDVAGKGLNAAIQIAAVKYGIRAFAYQNHSPSYVASMANDFMSREHMIGGFVTAFYGVIDIKDHTLVYTNAGHEPPLLRRQSGEVEKLLSDGIVFGVSPGFQYKEGVTRLQKGDRLLLYTDGITEARKESGEMLGEDRLFEIWADLSEDGAYKPMCQIYEDAREFSEGHFHDDVAILVIAAED